MKQAKYYIYRNLHTDTFSIRYRGKVIAHPRSFIAKNVTFKVNEISRQRVLREQRKNVHAFVVCDEWKELHVISWSSILKINYNPYKYSSFTFQGKSIKTYKTVLGIGGKDLYLTTQEFK